MQQLPHLVIVAKAQQQIVLLKLKIVRKDDFRREWLENWLIHIDRALRLQ